MEREDFKKEVEEARLERDVWRVVNKGRRRRERIGENITMEEWARYFSELMGGVEWRVTIGSSENDEIGEEDGNGIRKEEVTKVLRKLKDGKAVETDEIPSEVWKYRGEEVENWVWEVCNGVWRGETWPRSWEKGLIVPIKKKGDGKVVEEYRRVTITDTLYKIYASVVAEKLVIKMERKNILSKGQTGFRKKLGTIDNIR